MNRSYFFVRHGRAVYQERGFRRSAHPPDTDWPLAPAGQAQARAVVSPLLRFGVTRVVSSDLERAKQTASPLASLGSLPYEHRWPALNEIAPWKLRDPGKRRPEWWHGVRVATAMRRHLRGQPVHGVRLPQLEAQMRGVLAELDRLDEPRVAVVGHGYWILLCAMLLRGQPRKRWVDNCSITRIDADGRGDYRVVSFARPCHRV